MLPTPKKETEMTTNTKVDLGTKEITRDKKGHYTFTGVAELAGLCPAKQRVAGSGHMPGLQVHSPVSAHAGGS